MLPVHRRTTWLVTRTAAVRPSIRVPSGTTTVTGSPAPGATAFGPVPGSARMVQITHPGRRLSAWELQAMEEGTKPTEGDGTGSAVRASATATIPAAATATAQPPGGYGS